MEKTMEELTRCGLDCEDCGIYRATVYGEPLPSEVLSRWQADLKKYWNTDSVTSDQLVCHGCRSENNEDFWVFKGCPIRSCSIGKGLTSCGLCPEFAGCERHDIPEGKENLKRAIEARGRGRR